jgi:hypothetical protein
MFVKRMMMTTHGITYLRLSPCVEGFWDSRFGVFRTDLKVKGHALEMAHAGFRVANLGFRV